ncbi:MAG TPA: uroporphyrinogen-III synthase [Gemmatimonadaceae bacterium]|nr:uroporphyrinogen-III synthase [Gemmatimonadaceae bacterium]
MSDSAFSPPPPDPHAPLRGVRVVVTRAGDRADALSGALAALGAQVSAVPVTRIEALDPAPALAALRHLERYQWVVLTSQNAVAFLGERLQSAGRGSADFRDIRVAAVGPATAAALATLGIAVTLTPERFVAEALLDAMRTRGDMRGARVLYLAALGARDVLPEGLRALGAVVDVIPLYRSVPDVQDAQALCQRLLRGEVDLVTFTAGSAVRAFVQAVGADAAARAGIVTIGPATSAVVRELGLDVRAEADPSTIDGLVAATVSARP